jgi:oligoendopeptidase F
MSAAALSTLLSSPAVTAESTPLSGDLKRSEIPAKYRWNLDDIYADESAFEAAVRKLEGLIDRFGRLQGTLGRSAEALLTAMTLHDGLMAELDRAVVYAGLSYHEDMSASAAQGRFDRVQSLATRASEAASWVEPELLTLDSANLATWLDESDSLAVYRHYLDDVVRQRAHVLSPREEELLAMAGEIAAAPGNIFGRFTNTNLDYPTIQDENGKDVQLSSAKYYTFIYSKDRRVRRDAFIGLHKTYQDKASTLSAMLSSHVKTHLFNAKARGFASAREAALHGPNIPIAVYDNLVETVSGHVEKLHRYVRLRQRLMKLDEIHQYDLYVPLVESADDPIAYDEAVATILTSLEPLGDDYVSTLRRAFESRWIDVYETPNKRSGAYCWGSFLTHPYLLLNYHGTMNDRSTVAHEMGHAMHSWYTVRHQPFVYGDYATFCAEVASTVNEVLLAQYLLDHAATDMERLLILQQQIEGIRTTVFRQTMFAEFEHTIHAMSEADQPLTGDALQETYAKIVAKYYGPDATPDDCGAAECLRIPHFYRNFYVYTYATSHCAATNIGRRILSGDKGAVEGLMKFLSAGSSRYPLEILQLAGVDMTTPKPVEDTMALFAELLDQFEALYEEVMKPGRAAS